MLTRDLGCIPITYNLFDYYGHGRPILTLPQNRSRLSQGHNSYLHCSTLVQVYMPSFVEIGPLVLKKILKGFTIYGHGGHPGHVTLIIYVFIGYPLL